MRLHSESPIGSLLQYIVSPPWSPLNAHYPPAINRFRNRPLRRLDSALHWKYFRVGTYKIAFLIVQTIMSAQSVHVQKIGEMPTTLLSLSAPAVPMSPYRSRNGHKIPQWRNGMRRRQRCRSKEDPLIFSAFILHSIMWEVPCDIQISAYIMAS